MADYKEIENLIERYDKAVAGLEDDALERISASLDAAYRNMERELRRLYPEWASQGSLYASQRRLLLMSELGDLLSIVRPEQAEEYQQLFEELLQISHYTGASLADELVSTLDPSYPLAEFATIPIEAAVLQATEGVKRLYRYDEEFRTAASAIVEQGLIQGWGADKVAKGLRSQLGVTKSKAETLARTEVMGSLNQGATERYQANGIDFQQLTVTPSDALCPFCAGRNGNIYEVGLVQLPLHPRCRCYWLPLKKSWLEKGLIDTDFIEKYNRRNIEALAAQGLKPNTGLTSWEKKNGLKSAPKPYWKPGDTVPTTEAQSPAKPTPEPKPKKEPKPPKPPKPTTPAAARRWEDGKRLQSYESAAAYDGAGNLLFEKDGGEDSVSFTRAERERLRGGILTHNHPPEGKVPKSRYGDTGVGFSPEDLFFAIANDLQEMRAVAPGYRHSFRRPEGGWPVMGKDVADRYQAVYDEVLGAMDADLDAAKASDPERAKELSLRFNSEFWHRTAQEWAKREGFGYSREAWKEER